MLIVKSTEKNCCTCEHWRGTRIKEDDGFVYSLADLEGVCTAVTHRTQESVFLAAPSGSCHAWKLWVDTTEPLTIDLTQHYADEPALAEFGGRLPGFLDAHAVRGSRQTLRA